MRSSTQKMIPGGIILLLMILATTWIWPAAAENIPLSNSVEDEISLLLNQLSRTIAEEASLNKKMREESGKGIRPYAEYLLYQQSVRFAEHDARLAEIKMEKIKTIQRLALLQEKAGRSIGLLQGLRDASLPRGGSSYSGTPLLSFYDPTRFDPGYIPYSSFEMILFRFLSIAVLILTFSLPMIAINRGTVDLRRKGKAWIASSLSRMKRGPRSRPPEEIGQKPIKKAA